MKVIAINGSPNKNGNTHLALKAMSEELEKNNINTEILHIGRELIHGCIACGYCYTSESNCCVFKDDIVNEVSAKMREADGFILGSPVYYASIAGTMKSFLDRVFYTSSAYFKNKVATVVVAVRRSGGTEAFHQLNSYLSLAETITPPSQYWGIVYGCDPNEAKDDLEGIQTVRKTARDMAWLLKTIENGKGITLPEPEERIFTNFIR